MVSRHQGMFSALPAMDLSWFFWRIARIMHKFSTAATKPSALTAFRLVGLLNVPYSTFAGASVARLVRSSLSSPRDKNLCIVRACHHEMTASFLDTNLSEHVLLIILELEG